jgi:hypothetical protein
MTEDHALAHHTLIFLLGSIVWLNAPALPHNGLLHLNHVLYTAETRRE